VRWKLKHLFNSQLCQKNICQKLLKSADFFQVTIDNVGDVFFRFLFISTHISLDLLSLGSAEVRWETEWSFDGKLCHEYSYQKLSKSDN